MASALFSTSLFVSPPSREVKGYRRILPSSFYGNVVHLTSLIRREGSRSSGRCNVVASVLGRRVKKRETVIPDPDYRIPVVLLGLSGGLVYTNNLLPAAPIGLLGLLLLFQVMIMKTEKLFPIRSLHKTTFL
uniref:Uncharacterized protein n=1 Tax=Nelumbo nucifera TaxID=4432 RepID=A0A822Y810_NELNU|nr:TPA_asm: hypothetical protein HUJ06_028623 [Nelumbo nucifera]